MIDEIPILAVENMRELADCAAQMCIRDRYRSVALCFKRNQRTYLCYKAYSRSY